MAAEIRTRLQSLRRQTALVTERRRHPEAETLINRTYRSRGKRALDVLLAVPLVILILPAVIAAAGVVLLTSGWPVFYASERVGKDGRPFRVWKLRTMQKDADRVLAAWLQDPRMLDEYRRAYKVDDDSRVTWIGRFLRKSSLDEMPQLLNVIRGEMSLVGHRPITQEELRLNYGDASVQLLSVRPGITGPWQVGGRNDIGYPERVSIELNYAYSSSLMFDLRILLKTLLIPLRFNGR